MLVLAEAAGLAAVARAPGASAKALRAAARAQYPGWAAPAPRPGDATGAQLLVAPGQAPPDFAQVF